MKTQSYTAGGLSSGAASGMVQMTLSSNRLHSASKNKIFSKQDRTVKKKLNYNSREMPAALMRASKSQSAGRVAVQAKGRLSSLMRCKGSGEYNDAEVSNAIIHAKRMVQCAQMKVSNLKEEERMQKKYQQAAKAEEQQGKNEVKAKIVRQERQRQQKTGIEQLQMVEKEKSQQRELVQKRKIHRNQEQSKMNDADMAYLKEQIRALKGDPTAAYQDYGRIPMDSVKVELSESGQKLSDAQLEQMAETEAETSLEGAVVLPESGMAAPTGISADIPAAPTLNVAI